MDNIRLCIDKDLKNAMRARDQKKIDVLRLITSAIKQVEVDERIVVDDTRILSILDKLIKLRKESISCFETSGRNDLASQEKYEIDVIKKYLPEPLAEEDLRNLIQKTMQSLNAQKISDMGRVMAELKPLLQGRADMGLVSKLIKSKLA